MEYVILALLVLVLGLLLYSQLKRSTGIPGDIGQTALFVQQQIDSLRTEVNQNLKNASDTLALGLKATTDIVNHQLQIVTTQLSSVTQQLQTNTGQVGSRLDNAARVIQDVQNKLGELSKATQEIKELGQSVSKLEDLLKAPKLRGGLGELLLEDLMKQVLPPGTYQTQYAFRSGYKVDAIIQTAGGKIAVDAKFPFENFKKFIQAQSEQEQKAAYRIFISDVKKHIDNIAQKYIVPDEGTFDFALMYIPAENIYYETIIKDTILGEDESIHAYAIKRHVVPVSPNSFYAHLMVLHLGFKGLQIEKSAKEIRNALARLDTELKKFGDVFATLGVHITNAKNSYDKADKQLSSFADKLMVIQSAPEAEPPKQLDAFSDAASRGVSP
ncbi:MAG TPA: DNA recombination protein RmuC [Bacteroidota bacterium]|nr:DNA recombination protein RmuC [Bacteroidota bacterium]